MHKNELKRRNYLQSVRVFLWIALLGGAFIGSLENSQAQKNPSVEFIREQFPPDGQMRKISLKDLNSDMVHALDSNIPEMESVYKVSITKSKLVSFPRSLYGSQLRELDLSKNNFTAIPWQLLTVPYVQILDLSDNMISETKIPKDFENLEVLSDLSLHGNNLTKVDSSLLYIKSLQRIDLSDNHLQELPEFFLRFPNLKSVDFGGNPYFLSDSLRWLYFQRGVSLNIYQDFPPISYDSELSDSLRENVQFLSLNRTQFHYPSGKRKKYRRILKKENAYNKFKDEPYVMANIYPGIFFKNLKAIHIENYGFGNNLNVENQNPNYIQMDFTQLKNIEELVFAGNDIDYAFKTIPNWVTDLENLKTLIIVNSTITSIPRSIKNMSSLENLFLNYQVFDFPKLKNVDSIQSDKQVQEWLLGRNLQDLSFDTLPEETGLLKNLKRLFIAYSSLSNLPESFSELESLESLYLVNNVALNTEQAVQVILSIPNLKNLYFFYTDNRNKINIVTTEQEKLLRKKIPNCNL